MSRGNAKNFRGRRAAPRRSDGQACGEATAMPRIQPVRPGPGQESVWDYPRPPRLEPVAKRLRVVFNGVTVADTTAGFRGLVVSCSLAGLRGTNGLRRLLREPDRRVLRRRRTGRAPTGKFLRRLDHPRSGRALQRRAGHGGMVAACFVCARFISAVHFTRWRIGSRW